MIVEPPTTGSVGAVVTDVDLASLSATESDELRRAVYRYRVVVVKRQDLAPAAFVRFGNTLGTVRPYLQQNYHHPEYPEIFVSSNVERDGVKMGVARTGGYWHIDTAFMREPDIFTILSPRIIPTIPRSTLFLDLGELYRTMPEALRARLDGLWALHSGRWRFKVRPEDTGLDITEILEMIDRFAPPARHPAVIEHPATGERSLYVSSGFTVGFESLSIQEDHDLRRELFAYLERKEHVQELVWEAGDIIVWDNRLVSHRSGREIAPPSFARELSPYEQETMVFRVTAVDGLPLSRREPSDRGADEDRALGWTPIRAAAAPTFKADEGVTP